MLSDSRFTFGIYAGYRQAEFSVARIDHATRGDRLEETLNLLGHPWSDDGVDYSGDIFDLSYVSVNPKPVQDGGPPIWTGGTGPRTVRRAARRGDAWPIDPRISVPNLEKPAAYYDEQRDEVGPTTSLSPDLARGLSRREDGGSRGDDP